MWESARARGAACRRRGDTGRASGGGAGARRLPEPPCAFARGESWRGRGPRQLAAVGFEPPGTCDPGSGAGGRGLIELPIELTESEVQGRGSGAGGRGLVERAAAVLRTCPAHNYSWHRLRRRSARPGPAIGLALAPHRPRAAPNQAPRPPTNWSSAALSPTPVSPCRPAPARALSTSPISQSSTWDSPCL